MRKYVVYTRKEPALHYLWSVPITFLRRSHNERTSRYDGWQKLAESITYGKINRRVFYVLLILDHAYLHRWESPTAHYYFFYFYRNFNWVGQSDEHNFKQDFIN